MHRGAADESSQGNTLARWALAYAKMFDWAVLPLHPREKTPLGRLVPHGCRDASTNLDTITTWWWEVPTANVGVATGAASSIFVLDVDGPRGQASLDELVRQHGELPSTLVGLTGGGGSHYVFQHPGRSVPNRARVVDGLDIRGDGGYIVAPPSVHPSGTVYGWEGRPDQPVAPAPHWLLELIGKASRRTAVPRRENADAEKLIRAGEGRNDYLTRVAGGLRRQGFDQSALEATLREANTRICDPPLPDAEVRKIAWSVSRYPTADAGQPPKQATAHRQGARDSAPALSQYELSDIGAGEFFADVHRGAARFCYELNTWFVWDGQRWALDAGAEIDRLATQAARTYWQQVGSIRSDDERARYAKFACKLQNGNRLREMVRQAQHRLAVADTALDADPYLLNCHNGTLDLRRGTLREHRREDLLTLLSPVEFDVGSRSNLWEQVIAHSVPDETARAYMARAFGACLAGENVEKVVLAMVGPGDTGKTTVLEAILAALGDYGRSADPETFLASKHPQPGRARSDLVDLIGARLIAMAESEGRHGLNHVLVKRWSGGDALKVREMYGKASEARTTRNRGTLVFGVNELPRIDVDDSAIWNRLRVVPFEYVIKKKDPAIRRELQDPAKHGGAILAWLFRGYQAYGRDGLGSCDVVTAATNEAKESMDPLQEFLDERCAFDRVFWVAAAELRQAYCEFCQARGQRPLHPNAVGRILRARGCEPDKRTPPGFGRQVKGWRGLALLTLKGGGSDG